MLAFFGTAIAFFTAMRIMKEEPYDYISPIFERVVGNLGKGMAGFTIHLHGKPFANHIRFFDEETRSCVLQELLQFHGELILAAKKAKKTLP